MIEGNKGVGSPILNDLGAHVVFASAIISAYSAIEELGFEVRGRGDPRLSWVLQQRSPALGRAHRQVHGRRRAGVFRLAHGARG
jgi:hypothetical protein